ncbi:amine oxidase [Pseudomonas sp. PA15(2017)]|uniref:flavin monoamine oxidase family protein n=1 Tax=Pseudomonas sp. PA15(2017) TaxID=1932111 RepID=UPI000968DAEB|nr:FAD-dependent oxidoreductase [Pseudomonas sp. PA15(2017)]OLU34887.1 amine oxidase [Pseudomonas sp. PA15(2017)]
MTMNSARIAIIGGGLSGLYAAYALKQQGIDDYVVLEARNVLGGRIVSVQTHDTMAFEPPSSILERESFDLGPSWFWPDYQPQLHRLVQELELAYYEQYESGHMLLEQHAGMPPVAMSGYDSSPASMRIEGGMAALITALSRHLDAGHVKAGLAVKCLSVERQKVAVTCEDSFGQTTIWNVDHVLLALPPRLAATSITFVPKLPGEVSRSWEATSTWMAPHAKYFAVYDKPFWRNQGLSGQARSRVGPMGEIHDASIPGGKGALFGFLGIPATTRRNISENQLKDLCRAQLIRMFGEAAIKPEVEFYKDWSLEAYTATGLDLDASGHHAIAPMAAPNSGPWTEKITGIASEWSQQFPGYLAGAIEAAALGVQALQRRKLPHQFDVDR